MGVKTASSILTGCLLVVACSAMPAYKDQVESVPRAKPYGDQPIVDTGYFSDWQSPFSNPFGGLFDNIDTIMTQMRKELSSILQRFPMGRGPNTTEETDYPVIAGPFTRISGDDTLKGNTTSVTKLINGHKVVINETEYKNDDIHGGTFFKIRIVDIAPDSSEVTSEEEIPESVNAAKEDIDNSFENEIPKSKEAEPLASTHEQSEQFSNIETFDEVDHDKNSIPEIDFLADQGVPKSDAVRSSPLAVGQGWNDLEPVQSVDSNSINLDEEPFVPQLPIDLSRDTYVNEIMARKNAATDPDAEVFFVPEFLENKMMDPR
ncbi:hypothetical protein GWI33_016711 [Rhynchophorus ferrugineus]|uniref:Icarapin-like protein n=1 Tax=Rhynchophorus ferrugineus TaxID=354439 RepID=A0A834I338_RHYFE|nr:hypothetical protein GWI33_016711 [Rhynchophorus ferrugineus]